MTIKLQELHYLQRTVERIPIHNGWTLSKKAKCWYLAKFCWWILRKIKGLAPVIYDDVKYHRTRFNGQDIIEKIFKANRQLQIFALNPDKYVLILGAQTFAEMINTNPDIRHQFQFEAEIEYTGRLYLTKVHVIPDLEGFAMIPKVVLEEKRV